MIENKDEPFNYILTLFKADLGAENGKEERKYYALDLGKTKIILLVEWSVFITFPVTVTK